MTTARRTAARRTAGGPAAFGIPTLAGILVALSGCGSRGPELPTCFPVSGQVLIDGRPAVRAMVTFHPETPREDGKTYGSQTFTDDAGGFRMTTFTAGDGVPSDDYVVTIVAEWESENGQDVAVPDLLGGRYAAPAKSPLRVTVEEAPIELTPFELKSK